MKKIVISALLGLTLLLSSLVYAEQIDQIIAIVNDEMITQSEFNVELAQIKNQMFQQRMAIPGDKTLRQLVMDQLINKKLQMQFAKNANITVSDTEVTDAIKNIASKNNLSLSELYTQVSKQGMTVAKYRSQIHEQMLLSKLEQQAVAGHISVNPADVDAFLRMQRNAPDTSSKEYHLQDILIPVSDNPSTQELATAKQEAETIRAKLAQGQDFNSILQAAGNAAQGADLGWRPLEETPSAFTAQMLKLHTGQIAGPIETPNGFHLIKLLGMRVNSAKASVPSRKEAEEYLMQRNFEKEVKTWISKLRGEAYVKVINEQ